MVLGLLARVLAQRECDRIECLPPHLQTLALRYRDAIASVLGVPPEAIREDVVVRWVRDWAQAYVKPEYRSMVQALIYGEEPRYVRGKDTGFHVLY